MTREEWLEKNGFSQDEMTYCIFGDDTYSIKDKLKALGCKYSPLLKWHSPVPIDLPFVGYGNVAIAFNDILVWNEEDETAYYLDSAEAFIKLQFQIAEGPSSSIYYPSNPKDRIRDLTVTLKSIKSFLGKFGLTYIYTFVHKNFVLVWFTATQLNMERGETANITFTIKGFEEYHGEQTTLITRCIVQPIE
jgi:hypothetical protein